jgi:hypothetical protein
VKIKSRKKRRKGEREKGRRGEGDENNFLPFSLSPLLLFSCFIKSGDDRNPNRVLSIRLI